MTAPTLAPDAASCPDCRARLTEPGVCSACGLTLTGPVATRLWEVDCALLRLDDDRHRLLAERGSLLDQLRTGAPAAATTAIATDPRPTPREPRREWTPQRVQNLLLALGGLLLAGAALVFAAVTYDRLGASGRAVVLVLLTLVAGAAAPRLRARGLTATSETVGAVALALAALDAYGLRTLGLAQDSDPLVYAAVSAAVLAAGSAAYALVVPLRVLQVAAVALAQLPVPLLLGAADASTATAGLALAGLAAADVAVLAADRYRPLLPDASRSALWAAVVPVTATALPASGPLGLVVVAGVLAAAGALQDVALRALLTGAAVAVLGTAAHSLTRDDEVVAALVLASGALVAVLAAAQLPAAWRSGPVGGALVVSAGALVLVAAPVVEGVVLPLSWLVDPWALPVGRSARTALGPGLAWTGTVAAPVVLLAAALAVAAAGVALDRVRAAAVPVGVLAAATAVLLPLGLDLPYAAGLAVLLAAGAALAATGRLPLVVAGAVTVLHAVAWSTASETATLVVLPVAALLAAGGALRLPQAPAVPTATAALLAAAEVAALGAARGLSTPQVGGLLLLAVAALVLAARLLPVAARPGADAAALATAAAAVLLAAGDVGWLSWTLAGLGLLALATALRPERRVLAPAGALLLSASSWVRLADAGVTAPEPYVLPVAVVALVLGHLRRTAEPTTRSWAAYGPGLVLALVPSLLASLGGDDLTRPLLLGLAALGVLLLGARTRLQAPLTVGALVLAVDALQLLGPYAAALPRWLSLGAVGTLLVVVGATYEQRRADLSRIRDRFDALA